MLCSSTVRSSGHWAHHTPGPSLWPISNVDRLEINIWLVPSLIGNASAVLVVDLLLGPMYPICMNEAGKVLPRRVLIGSIGTLTYYFRRLFIFGH